VILFGDGTSPFAEFVVEPTDLNSNPFPKGWYTIFGPKFLRPGEVTESSFMIRTNLPWKVRIPYRDASFVDRLPGFAQKCVRLLRRPRINIELSSVIPKDDEFLQEATHNKTVEENAGNASPFPEP